MSKTTTADTIPVPTIKCKTVIENGSPMNMYITEPSVFETCWRNPIEKAFKDNEYTMMSNENSDAGRNDDQLKCTFDTLENIPRQNHQDHSIIHIPTKEGYKPSNVIFKVLYDSIPFKKQDVSGTLKKPGFNELLQKILRIPFVSYIYVSDEKFTPFKNEKMRYAGLFWYAFYLYDPDTKTSEWFLIEPFTKYFTEAFKTILRVCRNAFNNYNVNHLKIEKPVYNPYITEDRTGTIFFESEEYSDTGYLPLFPTVPRKIDVEKVATTKKDIASKRQESIDQIMSNTNSAPKSITPQKSKKSSKTKDTMIKNEEQDTFASSMRIDKIKDMFKRAKKEEDEEEKTAEDIESSSEDSVLNSDDKEFINDSNESESDYENNSDESEFDSSESESEEEEKIHRNTQLKKCVNADDNINNNDTKIYSKGLIPAILNPDAFKIDKNVIIPHMESLFTVDVHTCDEIKKKFSRIMSENEKRFLQQCRDGYTKKEGDYKLKPPPIYGKDNELDLETKLTTLTEGTEEYTILSRHIQRFIALLQHFARFPFLKHGMDYAELDIEALVSNFSDTTTRLKNAEATNTTLNSELLKYQHQNNTLKKEVEELNTQIDDLTQEKENLEDEIGKQKSIVDDLRQKIKTMESLVHKSEPKTKPLSETVKTEIPKQKSSVSTSLNKPQEQKQTRLGPPTNEIIMTLENPKKRPVVYDIKSDTNNKIAKTNHKTTPVSNHQSLVDPEDMDGFI